MTAMLAMTMALAALGIDLMLPAFGAIRADLGLAPDSTAVAGLVTTYFLGLAAGQLLWGPIADRFGRRPTLFAAFGVYAAGAAAATLMPTLAGLLWARLVWGVGAAGPRVVTFAVVRDRYEGERMAKVMSFIMAVFILVPIVAPTLGAGLVEVAPWRWVFGVCLIAVTAVGAWTWRRLPETLHEEHRRPLRMRPVARATREVVSHRQTAGYTVAMTLMYGSFTAYLGSSEAIFGEVLDSEALFPIMFGILAATMGVAMVVNGRLVERLGTRRFVHGVFAGYLTSTALLVAAAVVTDGRPSLPVFMVMMAPVLASHALMIPNMNTIALTPMGAIAGTASSVTGATMLAGGALLGSVVDRVFDGSILPLAWGFLVYGATAFLVVLWTEGGRLFVPLGGPVSEA